ncbi:hypothetical protein AB1046_16560 [Promicromonospora sp. Populi]|uniref:hypothetical protein n=1 Tax=Promicromonospora sp. Populi TaxID=3239420 RepID=UPI0034E1C9B5
MNPTALGGAHSALATPTHRTARRWRAGASFAVLALAASPFVATPAAAATAEAPVFTGTLAVDGTAAVGSALTIDQTGGTWAPEPESVAYSWLLSDDAVLDAADVPVDGAAAESITLAPAHLGKYLIGTVVATAAGESSEPVAAPAAGPVAPGDFVTTTPKVNGTPQIGGLVGATTGHFSPTASLTYQWKANGAAISGATSRTYTIPTSLHGDELTVTVTGSKTGYTTKSLTSPAVVVSRPFGQASYPTISGTIRVGQTLTASRGAWTPTPSVVTYQWRANGTPIAGATSSTYKLTTKEHGKKISVEIVGRKYAYLPATRLSSATVTVKWPVGISVPDVTTHPTRYTQTTVGKTVTFKTTATGGGLSYQWQRWTPATGTWTNIGANSSTYRFTASTAHELNQFRVVVSNMAGKDTSNRSYLWVQSTLSSPFPAYQWFSLWNYNATVSESADDFIGYLAATVYICAAPGYYVTGDVSVQFVGSNGVIYPGKGQEQPDHVSKGVPLDSDGCGWFNAYSEAPQSVREGGRWRVTDRSDGQTYHQYARYELPAVAALGGSSARTLGGVSPLGGPTGFAPVVEPRAALTD